MLCLNGSIHQRLKDRYSFGVRTLCLSCRYVSFLLGCPPSSSATCSNHLIIAILYPLDSACIKQIQAMDLLLSFARVLGITCPFRRSMLRSRLRWQVSCVVTSMQQPVHVSQKPHNKIHAIGLHISPLVKDRTAYETAV